MNGYPAEAMRMGVKPGAAGCWCMFGGNYPIFKEGKLISWDQRAGDWSCFVYLGNDDYWHIYMFGRVYNGDDSRWVSIWKGKKTSGAHPSGTFTRLSGDDGGTDTRPYVALNEIAQVATPTFSPAEGYYESSVEITLACATSGATIHYCLDDNDVCPEHQAYSGPLVFESGTSGNWVLLKFRAFKSGMGGSTQVVAYFEIYPPPPADPTFSPDGGSFVGSVDVTITPGDSSDYVNWWTDSGPSGGGTGPQVATLTASDTLYADTHNGSFYYGHHEAAYTIT